MKKSGFTLAEVIITIGLIGVVASVTMPTLIANVQKSQTPSALAKGITTLETAVKDRLFEENARSFDQITGNGSLFDASVGGIASVLNIKVINKPYNVTYYDYSNTVLETINTATFYMSQDGLLYIRKQDDNTIKTLTDEQIKKLPKNYSGKYYPIYIDANGFKAPNVLGKDLFYVLVDTKGYVFPYGGRAYQAYTSANSTLWETACNKTTVTNGSTCTGSIIDNGYKIIYKY